MKNIIKEEILSKFRSGLIASINIDGVTHHKTSTLPSDFLEKDYSFTIPRKSLNLFKHNKEFLKFILENFIENKSKIVLGCEKKTIFVNQITNHARVRFLTRFLIMKYIYYSYFQDHQLKRFNKSPSSFYSLVGSMFTKFLKNEGKDLSPLLAIRRFCVLNSEFIDKEIMDIISESSFVKNPNTILKNRLRRYNETAIAYINSSFLIVYGTMNSGIILTMEIAMSQKQKNKNRKLWEKTRYINSNTNQLLNKLVEILKGGKHESNECNRND